MKKTLLPLIIGSFLIHPSWLQSQDTQGPQVEAEIDEIKVKQYALTQDFRLVIQKPLVIEFQSDFLPGEAIIPPEMKSELNQIVDFLVWRANSDVEVVVHTDNSALSKARAASIKTYLIEEGGIAAARIIDASQESNNTNGGIEFRFITTIEEDAELQQLRFGTEISYTDSLPLTQVRYHSTLPLGWDYLENSGTLGGSIINPVTVDGKDIIWDLGDLTAQNGIDLEFSLVPVDHTQLASISILRSYLEYTYPNDPSAVTDAVNTSISTKVEEIIFRVVISGATFDVNSWELKPEAARLLTPLGNFLTWQPEIDIMIGGFSDNRGEADWNQELSENRAGSTRDYLAQVYGISPARIEVIGYGSQFPIATNTTGKGRALNRRVEFTVKTEFIQEVVADVVVLADSLVHVVSNPIVVISSTAGSPTNIFPIPVTATFSESVTGFKKDDVTIGNGSVRNFSGSDTFYTFDVTPFADGYVTVDIAANVAQDAVGENNMAASQFRITYDGTAPTVAVSSMDSSGTDTSIITFTVNFSERVTGFDTSDVIMVNSTWSSFSGSGATYILQVIPSADGTVTVDIGAGVAQDAAGNWNEAAPQFSIISGAPVVGWATSMVYLVGGGSLILVGATAAIIAARAEPVPVKEIGKPPAWPE